VDVAVVAAPLFPGASVAAIEAYIDVPDATLEQFLDTADDVVAVVEALQDWIRDARGDGAARATLENLDELLQALGVVYLRHRKPKAYAILRLLGFVYESLETGHEETLDVERVRDLLEDFPRYW